MTTKMQNYARADQARVPAGVPGSAGGQCAARALADSDVAIRDLSDEEYNADGSYAFPPRPRSAAQHIDFWTRVPLPEEKLETLIQRYPAVREGLGEEAGAHAANAYRRENPDPALRMMSGKERDAKVAAWQEEVGRVFDAAAARATAHMPQVVYRTSVRPIVRAHQMYKYAGPLPRDEREVVYNHEMVVDGRTMTVKEIWKAYELERMTNDLV